MKKILQVAQLGSPVIRQKAKPVKDIQDPQFQELIDSLLLTCEDFNGVGIAAPQVYESVRLFIMHSQPTPRYPKAPKMKPTPVINPRIVRKSKEIKKDWEGCLSIPGIRGLVPRPFEIEVEYTDRKGKLVKAKYKDFVARIFQHEYDHLDGIVFLDRVKSKDIVTEKEFPKVLKMQKI